MQTTVRWNWLPALLLESLLGGYIGAHITVAQSNRLVIRSFEIITVLVGVKLVAG